MYIRIYALDYLAHETRLYSGTTVTFESQQTLLLGLAKLKANLIKDYYTRINALCLL